MHPEDYGLFARNVLMNEFVTFFYNAFVIIMILDPDMNDIISHHITSSPNKMDFIKDTNNEDTFLVRTY